MDALFELEEVTEPWEPIYNALLVCRDCGRPNSGQQGGARPGDGLFNLCDDCAALDGWNKRGDGAADCSRWGVHTTPAKHEQLLNERERKRANYRNKAHR